MRDEEPPGLTGPAGGGGDGVERGDANNMAAAPDSRTPTLLNEERDDGFFGDDDETGEEEGGEADRVPPGEEEGEGLPLRLWRWRAFRRLNDGEATDDDELRL